MTHGGKKKFETSGTIEEAEEDENLSEEIFEQYMRKMSEAPEIVDLPTETEKNTLTEGLVDNLPSSVIEAQLKMRSKVGRMLSVFIDEKYDCQMDLSVWKRIMNIED